MFTMFMRGGQQLVNGDEHHDPRDQRQVETKYRRSELLHEKHVTDSRPHWFGKAGQ